MACGAESQFLPTSLLDEWIRQDIPYLDLTTMVLGLSGEPARARLLLRERAVVCGLAEAAAVYRRLGASAEPVAREGEWAPPGTVLLEARGSAGSLHAAWRTAQLLVALGSAAATYARLMAEKARRVNPGVVVAVARKAPPGLRHLYYRCVLCGGASLHRLGVSDTVLVFPNHTRVAGGPEAVLERLRKARPLIGERRVVVEAETLEEALLYARSGLVDEIQLDHLEPRALRDAVRKLKEANPGIKIAVGGGITLENVEDYAAAGVDVIVTSAPYWARPVDVTTRMEPLRNT